MNNIPADIANFLDSIAARETNSRFTSETVATASQLCIKYGIWKEQGSSSVEPAFNQTNGTNAAKALVEWLELISTTRALSLNPELIQLIAKQPIVETLLGALTEEGRSHHCRQLTKSLAMQEEWKSLSRQMEMFYPSMSLERERKSNGTSQAREATLAFLHESLQKAKDHTFELAYKAIVENYQAQRATT